MSLSEFEEFLKWMGDRPIPDPQHLPKSFQYLAKCFKYQKKKSSK